MESYNYRRESKRPRRNLFGVLINGVVLLLSIVAFVALFLTLLASYVNASVHWIFPVLGLLAPVVYICNLILALYWVIIWRLTFAIPMIILLLFGVSSISLFVNMEVKKDYGLESYRNMPKLMSFNVRGFIKDDKQWSTEQVGLYLEEQAPDIVCFQEYNPKAKALSANIKDKFNGFSIVEFNTLAIYSRYPIINKGNIFENDSCDRRSIWADVVIRNDTIRLFNNHLYSTAIRAEDDEYLTSSQIVHDTLRTDKIGDILSRFTAGSVGRNIQVDTIAMVIANSPYPVVVCGDFNDTPISRAYKVMSTGLKDSFQECGIGYSHTYRGFYNTLRIDYILVDDKITPHKYFVDEECLLSDHHPVMTILEINKLK